MDLSKSYDYFQPDAVREPLNIVGCGSVGATVAEHLARLGLTNITLWDMDVVDPHNLTNQIFRYKDIGHPKVEALADILTDINPDIKDTLKLYPKGWSGQQLSGYVFLCVDNIELRRQIVEKHMNNPYIKAMFDFRTRLEDAQHLLLLVGGPAVPQRLRRVGVAGPILRAEKYSRHGSHLTACRRYRCAAPGCTVQQRRPAERPAASPRR